MPVKSILIREDKLTSAGETLVVIALVKILTEQLIKLMGLKIISIGLFGNQRDQRKNKSRHIKFAIFKTSNKSHEIILNQILKGLIET